MPYMNQPWQLGVPGGYPGWGVGLPDLSQYALPDPTATVGPGYSIGMPQGSKSGGPIAHQNFGPVPHTMPDIGSVLLGSYGQKRRRRGYGGYGS